MSAAGVYVETADSDFEELVAILALHRVADDTFIGSHPSKNLLRTFGGQLMAQSFVAASRTLTHDPPPGALSVHLIAGGNPAKDIEFRVVRLRDERRFANRRVDAMQDGTLLSSAMISYLPLRRPQPGTRCRAAQGRRAGSERWQLPAVTSPEPGRNSRRHSRAPPNPHNDRARH